MQRAIDHAGLGLRAALVDLEDRLAAARATGGDLEPRDRLDRVVVTAVELEERASDGVREVKTTARRRL